MEIFTSTETIVHAQAAVVHLNFRAGSTFPVQVCTVSSDFGLIKQTLNRGLVGATILTRSDFILYIG